MKKSELKQLIKESLAEMGGIVTNKAMIVPSTPFNSKSPIKEENGDEDNIHLRVGNNIKIRANGFAEEYFNLCSRYDLMLNVDSHDPILNFDRTTTKRLQHLISVYAEHQVKNAKYQR